MTLETATTPAARWQAKALSAWQAWQSVTGAAPPNVNALMLFLAQAQFETDCGDVWADPLHIPSRCWGACDLEALTAAQKEAFAAGTLRIGDFLNRDGSWSTYHIPQSIGTIRGDSDPNTGAFKVWFAVFNTDAEGAAYMLRAGVRSARAAFIDPACSSFAYAKALYVQCCYFGGTHAGARVCGKRPDPLNAAETANVQAYADAIDRQLPAIHLGLATWAPPSAYSQAPNDVATGDNVTANNGVEQAPADVVEDEQLNTENTARFLASFGSLGRRIRRNPDPIVTP